MNIIAMRPQVRTPSHEKILLELEQFHAAKILKAILTDDAEAGEIGEQIASNIEPERMVKIVRALMRNDHEIVIALLLESFGKAVTYVAEARAIKDAPDDDASADWNHDRMMANRLF